MANTPPRPRYWGLSAKRFLSVAEEARFDELLGDAAGGWQAFCAARTRTGRDRAVLRLYAGEEAGGPYFIWLVYRLFDDEGRRLRFRLAAIALPGEDPQTRLDTPPDLEGEPFFAYPPGEPRSPR